MILITGAGGKTGRALIKALSNVRSVCAFVYHPEQVPEIKALGAEQVIVGDLRDEAALKSLRALKGVQAVYHICPNMNPDEVVIGRSVIDLARDLGVGHLVYHSVLHPQTEKMTHHWAKLHVEEMVFKSGLPFTILQPAPYMQNLLAGWKSIVDEGILRVPYSINARFSFVDLEDLAEAARMVLTEPNHTNATYELAGTFPLSHAEAAKIFSRVLNRVVRAEKEEIKGWRSHARGLSGYAMENLTRMFEYYDKFGLTANPNVLEYLLRRGAPRLSLS